MITYLQPNQQRVLVAPDYDLIHWVETNRVLDRRQSAEIGLKKISRTPYLRPLYDWFLNELVKMIIIQKPAQIGITDWVVDCILWIAVNDPSPTALFLADQDTARKIMRFRLDPAFRSLGLVRRKQARNRQQEISKFEIQLQNGFYLAVGWGSSISQTASMSFKRVFCDEVNKPGYAVIGDEGDTIGRISERMETYGDSKFVLLSSPTLDTGTITEEFNAADTIFDYGCKCPYCGHLQRLIFDNVVWQGGSKATAEQIRATVRYHCCACGEGWTNEQREQAVLNGEAIARSGSGSEKIAYQLHRLNSLFKGGDLARMTRTFLAAKNDPLKLQNIVNSAFGEPWTQKIVAREDVTKNLQACTSEHLRSDLPANTVAVIAGIDVQQNGFWYLIKAHTADTSTHAVDWGFVATWDELNYILFERKLGGKQVWRALIDSGGTKAAGALVSRTEEVYLWIRANSRRGVQLFACKGSSGSMATKLRVGKPLDKTPSGKPLSGGIRVVQINTEAIKDVISWQIEATATGELTAGGFYVPEDVDSEYIMQVTAEEKRVNRKGVAEWVTVRKNNHLLDCEVYAHAAADPELFGGVVRLIRQTARRRLANSEQKQGKQRRQPQENPYLVGY